MIPAVEASIEGNYQLNALLHGWAFQRAWHRGRLDLVAEVLPPRPDGLLLDAASGSGILSYRFPEAHVVSVDMRLGACAAVRAHTPHANAAAGELTSLPFRSSAFPQVYFLEALEHLSSDAGLRALRELYRVARPGGRCLVTTPNYGSYWRVLERLLDAVGATPPMGDAQHQTRYRMPTLVDAVVRAGWRVMRGGSFNLVAPLIGMCSPRAGARATAAESRTRPLAGALLFVLCEKDLQACAQ